jgi:hypothetical protein
MTRSVRTAPPPCELGTSPSRFKWTLRCATGPVACRPPGTTCHHAVNADFSPQTTRLFKICITPGRKSHARRRTTVTRTTRSTTRDRARWQSDDLADRRRHGCCIARRMGRRVERLVPPRSPSAGRSRTAPPHPRHRAARTPQSLRGDRSPAWQRQPRASYRDDRLHCRDRKQDPRSRRPAEWLAVVLISAVRRTSGPPGTGDASPQSAPRRRPRRVRNTLAAQPPWADFCRRTRFRDRRRQSPINKLQCVWLIAGCRGDVVINLRLGPR